MARNEPESGYVADDKSLDKEPEVAVAISGEDPSQNGLAPVPLTWKLMSVVLVTAIGFGSQWSSGITGAMKSTIKKEMNIDNKQFSLLEASEDFMVTALILFSGLVTDRIGGAGKHCPQPHPHRS